MKERDTTHRSSRFVRYSTLQEKQRERKRERIRAHKIESDWRELSSLFLLYIIRINDVVFSERYSAEVNV